MEFSGFGQEIFPSEENKLNSKQSLFLFKIYRIFECQSTDDFFDIVPEEYIRELARTKIVPISLLKELFNSKYNQQVVKIVAEYYNIQNFVSVNAEQFNVFCQQNNERKVSENNRDNFLIGFQGVLGCRERRLFQELLGGNNVVEKFLNTGIVPDQWLPLLYFAENGRELFNQYAGEYNNNRADTTTQILKNKPRKQRSGQGKRPKHKSKPKVNRKTRSRLNATNIRQQADDRQETPEETGKETNQIMRDIQEVISDSQTLIQFIRERFSDLATAEVEFFQENQLAGFLMLQLPEYRFRFIQEDRDIEIVGANKGKIILSIDKILNK